MKIFKFLGFFCLLAVQAEKCTFDECVSCSFVDANPTCKWFCGLKAGFCFQNNHFFLVYPDLKSLCASMNDCCASSYQVDLKKVIGNYGGLVNKKLDEEFKKLLDQRISQGKNPLVILGRPPRTDTRPSAVHETVHEVDGRPPSISVIKNHYGPSSETVLEVDGQLSKIR